MRRMPSRAASSLASSFVAVHVVAFDDVRFSSFLFLKHSHEDAFPSVMFFPVGSRTVHDLLDKYP